jgi:hypothetical protein
MAASLAYSTAGATVLAQSITISATANFGAVAEGQLLLAGIHVTAGQTPSAIPSGWTELGHSANGSLWVYYKWATASEPANYTWTNISSVTTNYIIGAIVGYKNVDRSNPFDTTPGLTSILNNNLINYGAVAFVHQDGIGLYFGGRQAAGDADISPGSSSFVTGNNTSNPADGFKEDKMFIYQHNTRSGTIAAVSYVSSTYLNWGSLSVGLRSATNKQSMI